MQLALPPVCQRREVEVHAEESARRDFALEKGFAFAGLDCICVFLCRCTVAVARGSVVVCVRRKSWVFREHCLVALQVHLFHGMREVCGYYSFHGGNRGSGVWAGPVPRGIPSVSENEDVYQKCDICRQTVISSGVDTCRLRTYASKEI